jgi:hypothetical protein
MNSNFVKISLIFVFCTLVSFGQLPRKSSVNGKSEAENLAIKCILTREISTSVCQGFPAQISIPANVNGGWPCGVRVRFEASSGINV